MTTNDTLPRIWTVSPIPKAELHDFAAADLEAQMFTPDELTEMEEHLFYRS